jgi:hypothetical protein
MLDLADTKETLNFTRDLQNTYSQKQPETSKQNKRTTTSILVSITAALKYSESTNIEGQEGGKY